MEDEAFPLYPMGGLFISISGTLMVTFLKVTELAKEKKDVGKLLEKHSEKLELPRSKSVAW